MTYDSSLENLPPYDSVLAIYLIFVMLLCLCECEIFNLNWVLFYKGNSWSFMILYELVSIVD